ncbi:MAG: hypothetical protein OI74_14875 [Gammaproteobacteria bacterium (ex Lamellibrachia satsuma)]|nr:MAG: hypothetical protein HPY30_09630 [Gammaproteobacteria bacterium (ex Lamellibrachia satsuma)]RRS31338.1 MAG: hypothetical protein OI74_14875 [Gammaproteobacteria bacterium (ex Lamellibrachia satsuma)]RRS36920.1 MAG: hypothetical protein NV67_03860 [Gammaproteobacteria bacterium (ex Lamellibrachia satsuma)]
MQQQEPPIRKPCVACREPIHQDAALCPHCGTPQHQSKWHYFTLSLKWIGGFTAILSLVIVANQTQELLGQWQNTQAAVSERVEGAKLQREIGDFNGAFQQLKQALKLDPSSSEARKFEVELAMEQLRIIMVVDQRFRHLEQPDPIKDNQLGLVLYRGAVSGSDKERATIMAHLGWLDILRHRSGVEGLNIDLHFRKALELDPNNLYANVMWGSWLPNRYNPAKYTEDKIALSRKYFAKAFQQKKQRRYVRKLQILAYQNHDLELLRIGHEMSQSGEFPELQPYPTQPFVDLISQSDQGQHSWDALTQQFSLEELLTLTAWLLAEYPELEDESGVYASQQQKEALYFTRGKVFADMGKHKQALDAFLKSQSLFIERIKFTSTRYAEKELHNLINPQLEALAKKLDILLKPALISYGGYANGSAMTAGLENGDLILFFDGVPLHSQSQLPERSSDPKTASIEALRSGKLLTIEFQANRHGINTRQILVPAALWDRKTTEMQGQQLHQTWINPHETIPPDAG